MATQVTLNSGSVDSAGSLALKTNGTTTAVTIDTSQNVGIGTASPTVKLDVRGNGLKIYDSGSATANLQVRNSTTGDAAGFTLQQDGVNTLFYNNSNGASVFATNGTERMRITSAGDVGIGTSSPSAKLAVVSGSLPNIATLQIGYSGSNNYYDANLHSFRNGSQTEVARIDSSGNLLVGLTSQTSTAATFAVSPSNNNGNAARIGLTSIGGISGGGGYPQVGYNTAFTSGTTINYLSSDFAAWIRYGTSGRIETFTAASGTGGTAISATTGPYVAQGGTSWTNSSDERLKDIIEPITGATNKIGQLRAVIGKFKTDPEDKRRSFLIAQDVQAVLPEAVDVSDPESLGVQYTDVIPLLVAAIKEQQAIITQLQADVAALKGTA